MFSREMTSKERTQKFHTNDVHYPDLDSASDSSSLEGDFSGMGSDRSSVWNFWACSLDVISRKSEVVSRDVDCFHRLQQSSRSSFPKAKF